MLSIKILAMSIPHSTSLISALKQMDEINRKLLLVFENEKYIGLITAGDIQRAIIQNLQLNSPVKNVLRKDIIVANYEQPIAQIKQTMLQNRIECMPLLNEEGILLDVYFWEDIFEVEKIQQTRRLNLPVVIMAGGKGTRLKPITNILPKPLIPLGEKSIIEIIMDKFMNAGCDEFYLSLNYKADMIKYYLNTLTDNQYKIQYFQENKPLGTAGSLFLLKDVFQSSFFVSNCDIVIDQDLGEIYDYHKDNNNEITLVAALKSYEIPYGTIESGENGLLVELVEKPEITYKINSGVYLLEAHLINEIPENTFFHITHLIEKILIRNGKIGVFPVSENSWKDIGQWDEYIKNASL